MKKTLFVLSLILCLCLMSSSVLAATKQDVLNYAKGTYVVGGTSVQLSSSDIVKIERFLNDNSLTEAQLDTALANMKTFVQTLQNAGTTDISKLSASDKSKLVNLMEATADVLGLTLNIDSNSGVISIYQNGKLLEQISVDKAVLQFTGADFNAKDLILPGILVIALIGIVIYKRKSVSNEI